MIEVYFDPSQYQVMEEGSAVITLRVNRTFSVAFDVNVTLMDITAIGMSCFINSINMFCCILCTAISL